MRRAAALLLLGALFWTGCSDGGRTETQARLHALARAVPFDKMGEHDVQIGHLIAQRQAAGKTYLLTSAALDSLRPPILTDAERAAYRAFHDYIVAMDVRDLAVPEERERFARMQQRLRAMRTDGTYEEFLNLY